jgi:NAD(P)-dependent dehydrogenase (short-subunit alcohol dehydrogenase family)
MHGSPMRNTVIVTGGSRGIGAATARLLAAKGWDVAISYISDAEAAADVVAACEALGAKAHAVQADLASAEDVVRLFETVDAELGRLHGLVNNAGIVGDAKERLDEFTRDRIERMLTVNVTGPFLCAGEAVRRMSSRYGGDGGVIVNVSSAAARLGGPGEYIDYAASKGAIDTMTVGLAKEVAEEGIRVNGVRPGLTNTTIHASGGQPDRVERLAPMVPLQRAGEPEEVASAIAWLCSDEASYVTGALLDVSGGR